MIQGTQVVLRKDPPYSWSYNSRRTIRDSFHWRISRTNSYDRQTSFRPLPRFNNFFTHAAPSLSSAMFGRDVDHRIWTISFSTVLQQLSDYAVVMAVMIGKTMKNMRKPWIPHGKKHMELWFCQNKNGPGNPWWQWWWYHGCYGNHGKHLWGLKIGFTQNSCV